MTRPVGIVRSAGEAGSARREAGRLGPADPASPAAVGSSFMPDSFHRPASPVKCRVAPDRHEVKRPFAKALSSATWGRCEQIAPRIHRSARLLRAWGNPEDPNLGPNQVLADVIDGALVAGATEDEALSPLAHLAERYGRTLAYRNDSAVDANGLTAAATDLIQTSASAAVACVDALGDSIVSGPELAAIEEQCDRLVNAAHMAKRRAQAAYGKGKP